MINNNNNPRKFVKECIFVTIFCILGIIGTIIAIAQFNPLEKQEATFCFFLLLVFFCVGMVSTTCGAQVGIQIYIKKKIDEIDTSVSRLLNEPKRLEKKND